MTSLHHDVWATASQWSRGQSSNRLLSTNLDTGNFFVKCLIALSGTPEHNNDSGAWVFCCISLHLCERPFSLTTADRGYTTVPLCGDYLLYDGASTNESPRNTQVMCGVICSTTSSSMFPYYVWMGRRSWFMFDDLFSIAISLGRACSSHWRSGRDIGRVDNRSAELSRRHSSNNQQNFSRRKRLTNQYYMFSDYVLEYFVLIRKQCVLNMYGYTKWVILRTLA